MSQSASPVAQTGAVPPWITQTSPLHAEPAGQQLVPQGDVPAPEHGTFASARFVWQSPALLHVAPSSQQLPWQQRPLVAPLAHVVHAVGAASHVKPSVQTPLDGQQPPSLQAL